jgi:hypothetical protein
VSELDGLALAVMLAYCWAGVADSWLGWRWAREMCREVRVLMVPAMAVHAAASTALGVPDVVGTAMMVLLWWWRRDDDDRWRRRMAKVAGVVRRRGARLVVVRV